MELIETQRGGQLLCYEGFSYNKRNQSSEANKIKWRCSQMNAYQCEGTINTNSAVDAVISSVEHNHDPDHERIEAMKLKADMKRLALLSLDTPATDIVSAVLTLTSISDEIKAAVGEVASVSRNIDRHRRVMLSTLSKEKSFSEQHANIETKVTKPTITKSKEIHAIGEISQMTQNEKLVKLVASQKRSSSTNIIPVNNVSGNTELTLKQLKGEVIGIDIVEKVVSTVEQNSLPLMEENAKVLEEELWQHSRGKLSSVVTLALSASADDVVFDTREIKAELEELPINRRSGRKRKLNSLLMDSYVHSKVLNSSKRASTEILQRHESPRPINSTAKTSTKIIASQINKKLNLPDDSAMLYVSEPASANHRTEISALDMEENHENTMLLCNSLALLISGLSRNKSRSRYLFLEKVRDAWVNDKDVDLVVVDSTAEDNAVSVISISGPDAQVEEQIADSLVSRISHQQGDLGDTQDDADGCAFTADICEDNEHNFDIVNNTESALEDVTVLISEPPSFETPTNVKASISQTVLSPTSSSPVKQKRLRCNLCNKCVTSLRRLHRHELTHHKTLPESGSEKHIQCGLCQRTLADRRGLAKHMRSHSGDRPYICNICGKGFNLSSTLLLHIRLHSGERPFKCLVCDKAFAQPSNLRQHMHTHNPAKQWSCELCSTVFPNRRTLSQHQDKNHAGEIAKSFRGPRDSATTTVATEKVFVCTQCGMTTKYQRSLENHMNIHANIRPYKCDLCPFSYHDLSSLRKHTVHHSGALNFVCTICGAAFPFSNSLRSHMRTHSDARPHVCPTCAKAFKTVSALNVHERQHTGARPFGCSICGKYFREQGSLIRHHNRHIGNRPYTCAKCGKGFIESTALACHMRIHTGDRPYVCTMCPQKFAMNNTLKKHVRCMHTCLVCDQLLPSDVLKEHKVKHAFDGVASRGGQTVTMPLLKRRGRGGSWGEARAMEVGMDRAAPMEQAGPMEQAVPVRRRGRPAEEFVVEDVVFEIIPDQNEYEAVNLYYDNGVEVENG